MHEHNIMMVERTCKAHITIDTITVTRLIVILVKYVCHYN